MSNPRQTSAISLLLGCAVIMLSGCMVRELKQDLVATSHDYGYLKGRLGSSPTDANVLVGLYRHGQDGLELTGVSSVAEGEEFFLLTSTGQHTLYAFADVNNDAKYQPGEPGIRIDNPLINWFEGMQINAQMDFAALNEQVVDLPGTGDLNLDVELDFSIATLRQRTSSAANYLRVIAWEDSRFSDESIQLGMWQPGEFFRQIGYGLYALKEFEPGQQTIVLVHGINDSPRVFQRLVQAFSGDYQILLFHYPSGVSLDYSSQILARALEGVLRQYDIAQLDVIAHSMGGLVSQGMLYKFDTTLRPRIRNFISLSTPFAGHAGAELGIKWAPTIAPVWWSMVPGSRYIQKLAQLDLSSGPSHHLLFSFSHEAGGSSQSDDGVVSVKSQLAYPAQKNATGVYGIADNHTGIVDNTCTTALLKSILVDGSSRVTFPDC